MSTYRALLVNAKNIKLDKDVSTTSVVILLDLVKKFHVRLPYTIVCSDYLTYLRRFEEIKGLLRLRGPYSVLWLECMFICPRSWRVPSHASIAYSQISCR
jgi:hypothetical protein